MMDSDVVANEEAQQSAPQDPRKSLWPVLLGVAFVILVIISLASIYGMRESLAGSDPDPESVVVAPVIGPVTATWLSDERHLAIQSFDTTDGTPMVEVVDTETEDSQVARGYVLVLAEIGAPVLWMLPMDAAEWASTQSGEEIGALPYPFDSPPEALVAWDLGVSDSAPSESVPARWRPVRGPGALDAYFEIDPLKGVYPSKLLFNNKESSGEGHKAQLPDGLATFNPIGWSPSGQYFAIEEILNSQRWESPADGVRQLLLIEAATGAVSDTVTIDEHFASSPVWHPAEDALLWSIFTDEEFGPGIALHALRPGEAPAEQITGPATPSEWSEVWLVEMAGASADESIWITQSDQSVIWRLGAESVDEIGALERAYTSVAWSAQGGIAAVEPDWDPETGDEWTVIAVYDTDGMNRREIWSAAVSCGGS